MLKPPHCLTHRVKIVEVTNVDFSLRHFLLPLMRGIAARGHEVVGVSADGPLLDDVRAEGLRVEPLPLARSLSPLAQWRALRAMLALLRRERPDLVHAHMPISGFIARLAARLAGVPTVAYTCHGFLFNQPAPWPRRALAFAIEWLGGRLTDLTLTVSTEEAADARRLGIARHPIPVGNGRDPARFHPDPAARARIRAELGCTPDTPVIVIVSRLVRHKGYPELLDAMQRRPRRRALDRRRAPRSPTMASTWNPSSPPPPWARVSAASATAPTSTTSSPPPTSSPSRAISRACPCPSSRPC